MDTFTITDKLVKVDTTSSADGYPRHLQVAFTADTMIELREAKEAAEADGCTVEVVRIHRRDGWAMWYRSNDYDLKDDRWMGESERDWTINITKDSDREQEAFEAVCGTGYQPEDASDLIAKARAVEYLTNELTDPEELEEGDVVKHFLDSDDWGIAYTVRTGQNGYYYDTHHHRTALIITEPEEETED